MAERDLSVATVRSMTRRPWCGEERIGSRMSNIRWGAYVMISKTFGMKALTRTWRHAGVC